MTKPKNVCGNESLFFYEIDEGLKNRIIAELRNDGSLVSGNNPWEVIPKESDKIKFWTYWDETSRKLECIVRHILYTSSGT